MLKKFLGLTFAVVALGVASTTFAACDFGTVTLRVGSKGEAVKAVQTAVKVTADGSFGPMTAAAVKAFQASNGLTADGVVGPMTKAKMSTACGTTTTGTTTTTGSTTLEGGAGDMKLTQTSTGVKNEVSEGNSEKVLGLKIEADGSDLAIKNIKVTLKEKTNDAKSYRLNDYAETVSVYKGSTKVGSVDASDFSKDGTEYSKTISLSNVVVKDGATDTFYVTVEAVSNLDSTDNNKVWDVTAGDTRYQDATGVIMSDSTTKTEDFTFKTLASSGDVKLTISKASSSPAIGNVEVSDDSTTEDVNLLDFKLKAAGSDMSFDTLSVVVTPTGATSAQMVDTYYLYNGSDELASTDTTTTGFDLDNDGTVEAGAETTAVVAVFDLDDTFTIDADSTETFSVKATMLEVDGVNFTQGDKLAVKLLPAGIEMENENGDVVTDESGSATGSEQSFYYDGAVVKYVSESFTAENIADTVDGTISLKFKVTAFGESDVTVLKDQFAAEGTAKATYNLGAVAGKVGYVLSGENVTDAVISSTDLTDDAGTYTVSAGDEATFTLSVKFNATTGFVNLEIESVDGTVVSNVKTGDK